MLITVGTHAKECTVFRRSNNGIVGSKPPRSRGCVCMFSVSVLSYVDKGLAMGQTIVQAVLPHVGVRTFVQRPHPATVLKNSTSPASAGHNLSACRIRALP
jgi:hypothetical protein